ALANRDGARTDLRRIQGGEAVQVTKTRWLKLGFVGPTLVVLITLNIFPLFYNVVLGFTDAELSQSDYSFIGARNYARIFDVITSPKFGDALRTTGVFV